MLSDEIETLKVIDQFCKTIKKIGAKRVTKALHELYKDKIEDYDLRVVNFIKENVCLNFLVSESSLNKPYLTADLFVCRSMSIVLIKKHLDLKNSQIANFFNKNNHTIVSHAITDFQNKNERIKEHKLFLEIYAKLDNEILKFKETLK